jgi:hypothetical protein
MTHPHISTGLYPGNIASTTYIELWIHYIPQENSYSQKNIACTKISNYGIHYIPQEKSYSQEDIASTNISNKDITLWKTLFPAGKDLLSGKHSQYRYIERWNK